MEENDNERLILTDNLTFQSWQQCKTSYGLQEGFSYKIRQSESEEWNFKKSHIRMCKIW